MKIADLFVSLTLKGAGDVAKGLGNTAKGLGAITGAAFTAKAGILAAFYGLERFMSASAKTGTELQQFSNLTGLSAKGLQQWQYAARQAGVGADEVTGTIKSVQAAMTDMLTTGHPPEGLGILAQVTGGFDVSKARDTFYVLNKMQEFSKLVPADIGNKVLRSMGGTDGVLLAMRQQAFTADKLSKAPTYSEKELGNLQKVGAAWANVSSKVEMAFGKMTARDGKQIVDQISKIVDKVIILSSELAKLAKQLHVLELIGKSFEGWGMIFSGLNELVASTTSALTNFDLQKTKDSAAKTLSDIVTPTATKDSIAMVAARQHLDEARGQGNHDNSVTVNQTLHFKDDGHDAGKTAKSWKSEIQKAGRQNPALGRGP